jgi:predicted nucleic acid-binding protein
VPPVLLDTSAIVGWLDRRDKNHGRCRVALTDLQPPLVTCEAVIAESCYLLQGIYGAPEAVLANVTNGSFQIPFQLTRSVSQVAASLRKYADLPADFADACLIQMADELDTGDILTLDSDFKHYRWRRNRPFHLLIPLE